MDTSANRDKTTAALAQEGLLLEDYEEGAVLVFVDGQLLADSESWLSQKEILDRARQYGATNCWSYVVQPGDAGQPVPTR